MIWALIGYMWLFIHRPFEEWPWLGDLRVERVYMILAILYWLSTSPGMLARNRLNWFFAFFFGAIVVSWILSPYAAAGQETVENYVKYGVFYVLLITSVRSEHGIRTIVLAHVVIMTLLMAHTLREYYNGARWWAQGVWRIKGVGVTFANYNDFAALVVLGLPFVWALWREWRERWKRLLLPCYVGISAYCVVLTNSRMGAIGFACAMGMAAVASPKRWRMMAVLPIVLIAAWFALPERTKLRYLTLVKDDVGPENAYQSAGNFRAGGFFGGLNLFRQRPLFGFGPLSYGSATGSKKMPHNMYGQLLGELGLAGTIPFACLALGAFWNSYEARRLSQHRQQSFLVKTVYAMSANFLLLLLMGWGFNFLFWHVWLWFGAVQIVALNTLQQQVALAECDLPTDQDCMHLHPQPTFG